MNVRALKTADLQAVAERVQVCLAYDAQRNRFVNPDFSRDDFMTAVANATDQTWVAVEAGGIVGHLFGALFENPEHGRSAWVGPDGVSFDDSDILDALYRTAGETWVERSVLDHYVWVFDNDADTASWYNLGFVRAHVRGILALTKRARESLPMGYTLRRGDVRDVSLAVELDRLIDEAQGDDRIVISSEDEIAVIEWRELLEDPEVHYYVVEFDGRGIAQCVTYPLESRRGSYNQTLHLSAVAVRPEHQHRGIARTMIDETLRDAHDADFLYAETNWRATNLRAAIFWTRYGFRSTYVQLRHTVANP